MITPKELREAIAECQGTRNPNANTCLKLAAYYTILDHVGPQPAEKSPQMAEYSYSNNDESVVLALNSGTEFARAVNGRSPNIILPVLDELMSVVQILQPRLYAATLEKIHEL